MIRVTVTVACFVGVIVLAVATPRLPVRNANAQAGPCDERLRASEAARSEFERGIEALEQAIESPSPISKAELAARLKTIRFSAARAAAKRGSAAMGPLDHSQLRTAVLEADGWDERLELVRRAAQDHRFTVSQVISLMNACEFDSTRVDLARILHPVLEDPGNWPQVYDALDFRGNRRQLQRYVEDIVPQR